MDKFPLPSHPEIEPKHLGQESENKLTAKENGHNIEINWLDDEVRATIDGKSVSSDEARALYDRYVLGEKTGEEKKRDELLNKVREIFDVMESDFLYAGEVLDEEDNMSHGKPDFESAKNELPQIISDKTQLDQIMAIIKDLEENYDLEEFPFDHAKEKILKILDPAHSEL